MSLYYSTKEHQKAEEKKNTEKRPVVTTYFVTVLDSDKETHKIVKHIVFKSKNREDCVRYASDNFVSRIVTTAINTFAELVKEGFDPKMLKDFTNPPMY